MKYAAILFILFSLAYTAKEDGRTDPAADKINAAYCYVNANCGEGTDLEITEAISKAAKIYGLDSAQVEAVAAGYYGQ